MSYRLHFLALVETASAANLCFSEDFAVVAGQTADGTMVLPTCSDTRYLVAAGVQGIPYLPQLGHEGGRVDYQFPQPVTAILVLTTSTQMPIPQAVYTPVVLTPKLVSLNPEGIKSVANGFGGYEYFYYWRATWSAAGDQAPQMIAVKAASPEVSPTPPIIGKTLAELQLDGFVVGV